MDTDKLSKDLTEQGYSVLDDFLVGDQLHLIQSAFTNHPKESFKPAKIGRLKGKTQNSSIRNDSIAWVDSSTPLLGNFFGEIAKLQTFLNRQFFLGLFSFEAHFARYEIGHFYHKHVDAFQGKSNRKVSFILYLNCNGNESDGGALMLYPAFQPYSKELKNSIKIFPKAGRAVIFFSEDFPHEVLPANRERMSLTGWFRIHSN